MVEDNMEKITKCIDLRKEIRESIISNFKRIKNIDFVAELKEFHSIDWLTNRPVALLQLSCSDLIYINTVGRAKMIVLSKIGGLICYTVNTKKALPSQSLEHMLCYIFTSCKS